LLGAVARTAIGGLPFALSGDLERDIRAGSAAVREVIGSPEFASTLPEIVRALLTRPPEVAFDVLAPNRLLLATEYERVAETSGFDPSIAPTLAFDLLLGAALAHLLATGSGPSREYSSQLAGVIVDGLRARTGTI
jgi:hypothetical protein